MADISAIGSALVIDEKVLNRIKEADDKLVSLQKTADETAKKIGTSFKGMSDSINPFLTALDNVITKLGSINTVAGNVGSGLSRINTNVGNLGSGASQATQGIVDLVNQLSQIGGKGASGVMQAVYAFQRLQESMKGNSGMNIAQLTEEINNINTKLTDTENLLTKSEQDALVKRRALLQDELKTQQRTYDERVIAFQTAIDKMQAAETSLNAKQRKNANERAKFYRDNNYQTNTTFEGSLKFADTANTYNRMATAVNYLNTAKKQLTITDADYDAKVQTLDAKIHSITLTMKQLSMTTEQRLAIQKNANKEAEAEINRQIKEDAANQKRIQSIRALNAELAKQKNYEKNTSFTGAISFADTANTYNRQAKAVEYLTVAKKNLSLTDSDYQTKVDAINQKLHALTNSMKERMMTSEQIADVQKKVNAEILQEIDSLQKEQAAYQKRTQAIKEMQAELAKEKNYNTNTTLDGALKFSETANTVNRRIKAIEYLQVARNKLSTTSKTYAEDEERIRKTIDRLVEANKNATSSTEELARRRQQSYSKQANLYKEQNYQQNTTYQGALDFSATANTLNRQIKAIEYLKEARLKLSQTDSDYKQKLEILNNAIKQHSKALKDAGVNARSLGEQTSYLSGYVSRLAQRTAVVFSMSAAKGFVEQIAEVRGQFELSERSLEAILQNKPKADEIFNKTVELAVKSPFRIKDLVDYTRQLSAYRIQSDKLYDTTKRLADVSAGLGVDMGRLILAYGQVKAAAYLRGSEVRQFTEAGINMYGELQSYFKEVKGEAYTTAQIVDMISKRKVTFEDVEAIFQRMTDKGGTFYNMQEIQAETLQGKISNLKDAFDVMLNDIGKENEDTFKGLISGATILLNNWDKIAAVGKDLAGVLALIMLQANKTGVSLKEMWTSTGFTTYSIKGKGALGILANSFKTLGSAARSAGLLMKNALVGNLPLLAFASLAQLVWNAVSAYTSFREEQEKINSETIEAKKRLGELSAEYERIKDKYASKKDSTGNRIVTDQTKFQKEAKSVLDSLNDELKAHKLEIPIEVKEPNAGDIDKAIQSSKTKLDKFIQMAQDAKSYINGEDNSWWNSNNLNLFGIPLWADSFSTDMKELDDAANDVREFSSRAQTAIDALGEGYDKLSAKSRAAYDTIKDGAKPGELDVEYLQRVNEIMGQIFKNESHNKSFKEYADKLREQLYGLDDNLGAVLGGSFKRAKEEANHELQGLFDTINNIYGSYLKKLKPAEVKVFFDNVATQNNLNELQKKILLTIAANVYHFKVDADPQSMNTTQQKIYSFMDDLQAEADRRKIKISLAVINPKNALDAVKGFQSSAKDIKELIDQINRGKIQWFHGSNLGISSTMKWNNQNVGTNTVFQKSTAIAFLQDQLKNVLEKNTLAGGTDPFATKNTNRRNTNKTDKAQRDILSERISLLKEMNQQYEKLDKYLDDETAATQVMKQYADNIKFVGMPDDVIKGFVPDKQGLIAALKKIEPTIADFKKRTQLKNDIIELQVQLDTEYMQQQLDDVKNEVSKAFDNLELYKKLKGEGLSDGMIKGMFGDLTSSFDEVRSKIDSEFTAKFGDKSKWSTDIAKQWQEQMDNLDKKVYQDQVNQAQELIKAYKQQLSDQLQLDAWYIAERDKIQNNANISKDKDLQKQLQDNLDKQYAQKTDANTWKDFQNSDMYIAIFENLDQTSKRVLTAMRARLDGLRSSLKNLSPEQLKQIVEQIDKIDTLLVEKDPYKSLGKNFAEYLKFAAKRKKLEKEHIEATKQEQILKNQQSNANKNVSRDEAAYNAAVKKYGITSQEAQEAKILWELDKSRLDVITEQLVAQGKITEEQAKQIRNGQKLEKTLQQQVQNIGKGFSDAASSISELFESMNDWGLNIEMPDELSEVVSGISKIGSSLESIDITKPFSIIKGTIGVLGGIGKTVGGIFGWGTKDKKLQKEIEEHQKAIEKLQNAYNDLKEAMDNAYDIAELAKYNDEMIKNLEMQNANLESMIKAEQDKKKSDDDKIEEYRKQIEANNKAIKEAEQTLTEELGGFGKESNFKSAAQAFAEAWVDAFNEGSDTLEALENKFDDYFNNMLKKQLTARAAEKYIQPILDAFDAAVAENSDGDNNGLEVTRSEIEAINKLKDKNLAAFDEYAKALMEVLNVKPSGSSNISALQQGIQSVTESTAQALESVLNSMRYYLAQQQADVRTIRDTLLERLGNTLTSISQDSANSPILVELRLQTGLLTDIRDTLDSCVKAGHKQGRSGIKVFMN